MCTPEVRPVRDNNSIVTASKTRIHLRPERCTKADMIGFTTFCAENIPRTVIDLLRELLSILSHQVFANDGTIDKFLGDGLMAVFGSPKAGPLDCTNAIRCALSMQHAVAEWNRRACRRDEEAIRIAIGIHSGHVII